jgi:hypothetical protein
VMDLNKMTEPTCTFKYGHRSLSESKNTEMGLLGAASKPQTSEHLSGHCSRLQAGMNSDETLVRIVRTWLSRSLAKRLSRYFVAIK